MVKSENLTTLTVLQYSRASPEIEKPITSPAINDAKRIPLPVAESQLKLNIAASGRGFATTGGTLTTSLSRPATGIFGAETPSRNAFVCGNPQRKTTKLRIIQGTHDRITCLE